MRRCSFHANSSPEYLCFRLSHILTHESVLSHDSTKLCLSSQTSDSESHTFSFQERKKINMAVFKIKLPVISLLRDKILKGLPKRHSDKESTTAGNARGTGSTPGSGRFPGAGNGKPLQDSCLNRGAQQGTAHGVTKRQTRLSTAPPPPLKKQSCIG